MPASSFFLLLFRFFLPPAIIGTIWLYYYPAIQSCAFPEAKRAEAACFIPGSERAAVPAELASFRLLALGDPQLEGDTSLPDPNAPAFPSLTRLRQIATDDGLISAAPAIWPTTQALLADDLPWLLRKYRKQLDLFGNDHYLAHIYRSVEWWTQPTHTVVLGDLLGSQWISDGEFEKRSRRFWDRVFKNAEIVPNKITSTSGRVERLGQDQRWKKRIIAVAGNHDIGYAGDIDEHRVSRFEGAFGHVNWAIRFKLNGTGLEEPRTALGGLQALQQHSEPELHLVVLNSMNLDAPAYNQQLRDQSWESWSSVSERDRTDTNPLKATVLLTHIPLHKKAGVCVDAPFFTYFPPDQSGGIREQNHLTPETSRAILEGLGSQGIILNGHDHEGCDTYHYRQQSPLERPPPLDEIEDTSDEPHTEARAIWEAKHFRLARTELRNESLQGFREITVRSMMGSFGGNAGLLSGWFDAETQQWRFEYATCVLGVQHIWWAIHVLVLVEAGFGLTALLALAWEHAAAGRTRKYKSE